LRRAPSLGRERVIIFLGQNGSPSCAGKIRGEADGTKGLAGRLDTPTLFIFVRFKETWLFDAWGIADTESLRIAVLPLHALSVESDVVV
jgi:hypothetical protein